MRSNGRQPATGRAGRYDSLQPTGTSKALSYSDIDAALLFDAVVAVTSVGDAIVFARTADGGAFSIRVLSGGQATKWWPDDVDGCNLLLQGLVGLPE